MSILENIKYWFTSETARNKNSSLIAGLLVITFKNTIHKIFSKFFVLITYLHRRFVYGFGITSLYTTPPWWGCYKLVVMFAK